MIEMRVEEGGKTFEIDEKTGLVKEASIADEQEILIGSRVEAEGEVGEVISITASMYGNAYGVRFDNGDVDEYDVSQLTSSVAEKPEYADPLEEVHERFAAYVKMPDYTNDEINSKLEEARQINLRVHVLASSPKLALNEQSELGRIALVTQNDQIDLVTLRDSSEESAEYIKQFNRYRIAEEVSGYGAELGSRSDASWLSDAIEDMEVVETTDADLAARATELVASFNKAQLEDDDFMQLASSFHRSYLQMDDAQVSKFESYLARARQERVSEFVETKVAAVDDSSTDDFDTSALYL